MKTLLFPLVLLLFHVNNGFAQEGEIALRFNESSSELRTERCFDIEVKLNSDTPYYLGSQNFRFYYDASVMRFLRTRTSSYLTSNAYREVNVLQAVHNSNASGFGNLDFSENLGFVNIVLSDQGNLEGLTSLQPEQWTKCIRTCFEMQPEDTSFAVVWARDGLTNGYATAFTIISLADNNHSFSANIIEYQDLQVQNPILNSRMAISGSKNN